MTLDDFKSTLQHRSPPPDLSNPLRALWEDAKGNWNRAHEIAQDIDDETGAWIHAYLHRKEGDEGNAAHWYRRAGQPVARGTLEAEWERIVTAVLKQT
jgi:hypothetical protein